MDIDFALVLVILVAVCGGIWLLDSLLLRKIRIKNQEQQQSRHTRAKTDEGKSRQLEELEKEPIIVEYAKSFFPVLLIVLVLRSFVLEPFQIPTGSMIPTLAVGDFILVNKYAYGLRLPVLGTKIMHVDEPKRGEVMVFIPPHVDQYYIKRVIGLPGDRIRYEDKVLYINGEEVHREYAESIEISLENLSIPGTKFREEIGGIVHDMQLSDMVQNRGLRTSWIVPEDHYFMMGDNRDNSLDSRSWGPVHESKIVGKAVAIWLHKDPGLNLPNFSRNQLIK